MGSISYLILQLLFVLQLQTLVVLSQNITNGYVPVGESLTASESQQFSSSWRSSSGDFAFGFRKIQPNDGFTLSIWFDKISEKTIVWYAQDVNTTTGLIPNGSKITLTANNGLVITDPRGQQLWSSLSGDGSSVSRGRMTDDGNFVLFREGSEDSNEFLWSSFANPTDTLLPNQVIDSLQIITTESLSSRRTEASFKKGRFSLRLSSDGKLQLLFLNSQSDVYLSYFETNTNGSIRNRLMFNESGYIYVLQTNNTRYVLNKKDPQSSVDFYHRAVLHFDGVFAMYYHPKGKENSGSGWVFDWAEPDNICTYAGSLGSIPCGFNSLCSLGQNQRPKCECPERFVLRDSSDENGDCVPDFEMQTCNKTVNSDASLYGFISFKNTNWPSGDYERYENYDEERCKASCLNDCFCAAVVLDIDQYCWKKKFPLSNGRYGNDDEYGDSFVKVPKRAATTVDSSIYRKRVKNRNQWLIIVGSVLIGTSVFLNLIFLVLQKNKRRDQTVDRDANELNLRAFTYRELEAATGDFTEELGRGAFGIVYKGYLKVSDDSEVAVAVKKLDRVAQENEKEFKNEIKVISQTHHKNLVRLLGYCSEGQNRMIVYEFLPNGTLASFLFRRPRPNWEDRRRIAVGIARGILYLHEECNEQILHCDIKPQNILLDEYYNPQISDFGRAKVLMMNQTHTLRTNIRGTKGYIAAEWFRNRPITSKVDVYSYGVMLLEIMCCKKAVDLEDNMILIDWAYDCFREGRILDLVRGDLEAIDDMKIVERYVKIAIWCIQEEPEIRPNMRKVIQMLEGLAKVHDPPNPCPYSVVTCVESSGPVS